MLPFSAIIFSSKRLPLTAATCQLCLPHLLVASTFCCQLLLQLSPLLAANACRYCHYSLSPLTGTSSCSHNLQLLFVSTTCPKGLLPVLAACANAQHYSRLCHLLPTLVACAFNMCILLPITATCCRLCFPISLATTCACLCYLPPVLAA